MQLILLCLFSESKRCSFQPCTACVVLSNSGCPGQKYLDLYSLGLAPGVGRGWSLLFAMELEPSLALGTRFCVLHCFVSPKSGA